MTAELMELFLDQAPEILTSLREAVEANDPGGNQRSAHYLRGSSGNIGAMRVEALCAELEALGGSGKVDETTDVLAMLQKTFDEGGSRTGCSRCLVEVLGGLTSAWAVARGRRFRWVE